MCQGCGSAAGGSGDTQTLDISGFVLLLPGLEQQAIHDSANLLESFGEMPDPTNGRFVVYSPQGKQGMPPGSYKVTVSRREPKTPVAEGTAVIDSDLVEQVPAAYSDPEKTELSATIGAKGDGELRFTLGGGRTAAEP